MSRCTPSLILHASLTTMLFVLAFSVAGCKVHAAETVSDGQVLIEQQDNLLAKDKSLRMDAMKLIAASTSEHKSRWLQALLNGDMYLHKKDKVLVIGSKAGRDLQIHNAVDGSDLGVISKRKLKKYRWITECAKSCAPLSILWQLWIPIRPGGFQR